MESSELLEHGFSPSDRRAGESLVLRRAVRLTTRTEERVDALVTQGGGQRVSLRAISAEDILVTAGCTCSRGKKGRPCAHVFAAVQFALSEATNFMASRTQLAFGISEIRAKAPTAAENARSAKQAEYKDRQRERAREYRRGRREAAKTFVPAAADASPSQFPPEIEAALAYFDQNGFALGADVNKTSLSDAKRQLARIFHPDRGGTHQEMLELNQYFEALNNALDD